MCEDYNTAVHLLILSSCRSSSTLKVCECMWVYTWLFSLIVCCYDTIAVILEDMQVLLRAEYLSGILRACTSHFFFFICETDCNWRSLTENLHRHIQGPFVVSCIIVCSRRLAVNGGCPAQPLHTICSTNAL